MKLRNQFLQSERLIGKALEGINRDYYSLGTENFHI